MRHISLGYLNISQKGKEYVNDALNSNRLSRGKYTNLFETEFAALHGCKHAIFMNSGTSALQVSLAALKEVYGYQDGDEVIVPAMTFIATSNVVIQNNLKPVFVDVDYETFNISPVHIREAITEKTRAIIPAHLFGLPADMNFISLIAKSYGLQVLEDSCETILATTGSRETGFAPVGSFGDLACFSMYVNHLITGGVGGLVTTNDDQLADICRSLMAHGRNPSYLSIDDDDNTNNLQTIMERRYQFDRIGYSYRATELEAAIALSELENCQSNIATRQSNASLLTYLLKDVDFLQLPRIPPNTEHVFMMYPMVLEDKLDRDAFLLYLERNGIETRYLLPLLSQPVYRRMFPREESRHPVARRLSERGFFIGVHQGLTTEDIQYIADAIKAYQR